MIKEIKYKGFTSTPSDYECPDGELSAAINLVPEDSELHPIEGGRVVLDLNEESLEAFTPIYIHKNSSPYYKHLILLDKSEGKLLWLDEENVNWWLCRADLTDKDIKDVIAIGNTLVFLSPTSTYYVLWSDTEQDYIYLGTKLPELPISFGLQAKHVAKYIGGDIGDYYNEFPAGDNDRWIALSEFEAIISDASTTYSHNKLNIPSALVEYYTNIIDAEVKNLLADKCTNKDKFGLPFMVRCAYRLKDNKGWINRSSPVLMIPWTIPECNVNHISTPNNRLYSMAVSVHTFAADLDYAVFGNDTYAQKLIDDIKKWGDIIESVDIFVSPPMYFWQYDEKIRYIINRNDYWESHYHVPRLNISKWLATGGDVDAGSDNHVSDDEYYDVNKNPTFNTYQTRASFAYPAKTEEEIRDIIVSEGRFYRVASIKLSDLAIGRHVVEIEEGALKSLTGREQLDEVGAAHDHNSYTYNGGFVYNGRLVFYDINKVSGVTETNANTLIPYTNNDYINNNTTGYGNFRIYTAIDKARQAKVYKHNNGGTPTTTGLISHNGIPVPYIFLQDEDITDIAVTYAALGTPLRLKEYKPTKHTTLIGSYLYLGFNNIADVLPQGDLNSIQTELGGKHIQKYSNQLYVSDVNQPFLFSSANTVDIDAGGIIAVESAVKALSQGQFGQFPLYVFTDAGVWAMNIADDGTFSSVKPVTFDVCINPKSITKMETTVLFATDRGIMLLHGSESICITDSIYTEAVFALSDLQRLSNLSYDMITTAGTIVPFKQFLPAARMLYDYTHQRIIVYNPEMAYAYVYSLKSKQWGMMESAIKYGINSYPECLAVDGENRIIDLSSVPEVSTLSAGSGSAAATFTPTSLLVTRPLKLDAPDILKTVDTIIQRGKFRKGHVQTILYGSRDLFNWHLVYSSKDHFLRGFRGTPYKYFRVVLLCNLAKDESIFGCTVQFTPRLTNQPR